ncbi:hypothetical protein WI90_00050 [Burkholderia ubonensis]|nr:hypothetical protein WI90_00050 [Burkholderia ubonensis]
MKSALEELSCDRQRGGNALFDIQCLALFGQPNMFASLADFRVVVKDMSMRLGAQCFSDNVDDIQFSMLRRKHLLIFVWSEFDTDFTSREPFDLDS